MFAEGTLRKAGFLSSWNRKLGSTRKVEALCAGKTVEGVVVFVKVGADAVGPRPLVLLKKREGEKVYETKPELDRPTYFPVYYILVQIEIYISKYNLTSNAKTSNVWESFRWKRLCLLTVFPEPPKKLASASGASIRL